MGKSYEVRRLAAESDRQDVSVCPLGPARVESLGPLEVLPRVRGNEYYDQLRASLLGQHLGNSDRVLLFTAATRRVGVTVTSANFGMALAEDLATKILLVDCNPTAPNLDSFFDIGATDGIAELLGHCTPRSLTPHKVKANLHIASYGRLRPDPIALFRSAQFAQFLSDASDRYDYVILDAPPILEAPAASVLCTRADGAILVAQAARTRGAVAQKAKRRIEDIGTKVFGVVLNRRQYIIPKLLYRWI